MLRRQAADRVGARSREEALQRFPITLTLPVSLPEWCQANREILQGLSTPVRSGYARGLLLRAGRRAAGADDGIADPGVGSAGAGMEGSDAPVGSGAGETGKGT